METIQTNNKISLDDVYLLGRHFRLFFMTFVHEKRNYNPIFGRHGKVMDVVDPYAQLLMHTGPGSFPTKVWDKDELFKELDTWLEEDIEYTSSFLTKEDVTSNDIVFGIVKDNKCKRFLIRNYKKVQMLIEEIRSAIEKREEAFSELFDCIQDATDIPVEPMIAEYFSYKNIEVASHGDGTLYEPHKGLL